MKTDNKAPGSEPKILVPIAQGSEEMEAVIAIDVLRRAGMDVCVAAVGELNTRCSRDVVIQADITLSELAAQDWDLILLPGGMPGAKHLSESEHLLELLEAQLKQGRWLAAICAAPEVVLARAGLIADKVATCHPGFQQQLATQVAELSLDRVVVDGNLVTSQGPGTAFEFALTLVELLKGPALRLELEKAMVIR